MLKRYKTSWGSPEPLPFGAIPEKNGVFFRLFSRHSTRAWILLFNKPEDEEPAAEIEFDPRYYRSGDIWHMFVEGLGPGQLYLYRIDGPNDPVNGHRYNSQQLLLDPYAKAVTSLFPWGDKSIKKKLIQMAREDPDYYYKLKFAGLPKCVVIDDAFDWEGDRHLRIPPNDAIIYEVHTRGLTIHPSSLCKYPGTFRGITEVIQHLNELGINSIELMPIHDFNEYELDRANPLTGETLFNYWGYSTVSFFAPNAQYSSSGVAGEQVIEFKEMVKKLHSAGIEIILDVVFNHTAEGNANGPVMCFKGIDNSVYYLLGEDKRIYLNFSGCGNTLNCNHPVVNQYIMSCLRYWFLHMHVDGFRFDLASILGRDRHGRLLDNPPLLEAISEDPLLRNAKIIAEAWDAAGAYQVGWFPGGRWSEWNGRYRDDVRRFWRGDEGMRSRFAYRITGSSDLYQDDGRKPFNSINFITSHDGFTLNDLVSYNEKHNEANGEDNRDGDNNNYSYNHGVEGKTDDPEIEAIRVRQIKNIFATLMISQGVPMFRMGDEFRRTQKGNNNAYCQDNEINWADWRLKGIHKDVYRFCRLAIAFRKKHSVFHRIDFFNGNLICENKFPDIQWFDCDGKTTDWESDCKTLACFINGLSVKDVFGIQDNDIFIMFNASEREQEFLLPQPAGKGSWAVAIDTFQPSPQDIAEPGNEKLLTGENTYHLVPRSMAVLVC